MWRFVLKRVAGLVPTVVERIARLPFLGRTIAIALTAIGTDAETVNPTRNAR